MRTNIKKIFAVLLTVALVATMFVMPANATKTYGEFLNDAVVNGDFEVGVEGLTPYGWGYHGSSNAHKLNATPTSYSNAISIKTYIDGTNKVAKLGKHGAGYGAMVSQPISVVGGATYTISFD